MAALPFPQPEGVASATLSPDETRIDAYAKWSLGECPECRRTQALVSEVNGRCALCIERMRRRARRQLEEASFVYSIAELIEDAEACEYDVRSKDVIEIYDEPATLQAGYVARSVDWSKVRKMLAAGKPVPGARIVGKEYVLRKRVSA